MEYNAYPRLRRVPDYKTILDLYLIKIMVGTRTAFWGSDLIDKRTLLHKWPKTGLIEDVTANRYYDINKRTNAAKYHNFFKFANGSRVEAVYRGGTLMGTVFEHLMYKGELWYNVELDSQPPPYYWFRSDQVMHLGQPWLIPLLLARTRLFWRWRRSAYMFLYNSVFASALMPPDSVWWTQYKDAGGERWWWKGDGQWFYESAHGNWTKYQDIPTKIHFFAYSGQMKNMCHLPRGVGSEA